jgi:hypothetical protein
MIGADAVATFGINRLMDRLADRQFAFETFVRRT